MERSRTHVWKTTFAAVLLVTVSTDALAAEKTPTTMPVGVVHTGVTGLAEGESIELAGRQVSVMRADGLRLVENEYSRRFVYDKFENPKLKELRKIAGLDEVVAKGKTEFEKQVLLMGWVRAQFPFGHPPKDGFRNALTIMKHARAGKKGHCVQYSALLTSAAASLGWISRPMAFPKHSYNEIWSNQHRKWVMFDPTRPGYAELNGVPLNAYELRMAWYIGKGKGLTWVWTRHGKAPQRVKIADSKSLTSYVPRFCFLGYIPNTNWLDAGPDYAKFYIVKDKFCGDRKWHRRDNPPDPAKTCYWPMNQAALTFAPAGGNLKVSIKTLTPNFKEYQIRQAEGKWRTSGDSFLWRLAEGRNVLQARSVNKFDVAGPVSTVELNVATAPNQSGVK